LQKSSNSLFLIQKVPNCPLKALNKKKDNKVTLYAHMLAGSFSRKSVPSEAVLVQGKFLMFSANGLGA